MRTHADWELLAAAGVGGQVMEQAAKLGCVCSLQQAWKVQVATEQIAAAPVSSNTAIITSLRLAATHSTAGAVRLRAPLEPVKSAPTAARCRAGPACLRAYSA